MNVQLFLANQIEMSLTKLCHGDLKLTKILNILQKTNICENCSLRYLGIRDYQIHKNYFTHSFSPSSENIQPSAIVGSTNTCEDLLPGQINLETVAKKPKLDQLCLGCLGILQLNYNELVSKAHQLMISKDFKLGQNTFSLFIQLPYQLLIRHQAIIHYIKSVE